MDRKGSRLEESDSATLPLRVAVGGALRYRGQHRGHMDRHGRGLGRDGGDVSAYRPTRVSHPGGTLRDLLAEHGWKQADLAAKIRRPRKTICEIVKGKARITATTALQLERAGFGTARFWMVRQMDYDLWRARRGRR